MADDTQPTLNPCPLCGSAEGYKLLEGSTFRWWQVVCAACGERVTECRSDPGVRWDRVPSSHPHADAAWQEATKHYAALLAQVAALQAEVGRLQAERDALRALLDRVVTNVGRTMSPDLRADIDGALDSARAAKEPAR